MVSGNCIDVCKKALNAGNLKDGTVPTIDNNLISILLTAIGNEIPNEVYKGVIVQNKGVDISKQLVPDKKIPGKLEMVNKK